MGKCGEASTVRAAPGGAIQLLPFPSAVIGLIFQLMFKSSPLLLLPLLSLCADTPKVAHEKGRRLVRTYDVSTVRSIDTAVLTLLDQEQDVGSGTERSRTLSLVVEDKMLTVAGGAPLKFSRGFSTVLSEQEVGEVEGVEVLDSTGSSELEGLGVTFTREAQDQEWACEYDEGSEGESSWLDELTPGMDLSSILPEEHVDVGDSWDVPVAILGHLLHPGGTVDVSTPEDVDVPEGGIAVRVPKGPENGGWASFEGDVVARYDSIDEENGRRARIVLTLELSSELDRSEELELEAAERGTEETYSEAKLIRDLSGEVVILWDLIGHHVLSAEGTLTGSTQLRAAWTISGPMELELKYEEEGSVEHAISMEVEATGPKAD